MNELSQKNNNNLTINNKKPKNNNNLSNNNNINNIKKRRGVKKGYIKTLKLKLLKFQQLLNEHIIYIPTDLRRKIFEIIKPIKIINNNNNFLIDNKNNHVQISIYDIKKYFGEPSIPYIYSELINNNNKLIVPEMGLIKSNKATKLLSSTTMLLQSFNNNNKKSGGSSISSSITSSEFIDSRLNNYELIKYYINEYIKNVDLYFPIIDKNFLMYKISKKSFTNINDDFYCSKLPNYLFYSIIITVNLTNKNIIKNTKILNNNSLVNLLKLNCDCYEYLKELIAGPFIFSEHPNITIIQCILLFVIGMSPRNKLFPWIYSGIAIKMAILLKLNDQTSNSNKTTTITENNNRIVWWGCYVVDKMVSLSCGRPSIIMEENFDVETIQTNNNNNNNTRLVYFEQLINLTKIMDLMLRTIYNTSKQQLKYKSKQQELTTIIEFIIKKLNKWYKQMEHKYYLIKRNNNNNNNVIVNIDLVFMYFYLMKMLCYKKLLSIKSSLSIKSDNSNYIKLMVKYADDVVILIKENLNDFVSFGLIFKTYSLAMALSVYLIKIQSLVINNNNNNDSILIYKNKIYNCLVIFNLLKYQMYNYKVFITIIIKKLNSMNIFISDLIMKNNNKSLLLLLDNQKNNNINIFEMIYRYENNIK